MEAKGSLWASAAAAIGASLCCVAPLVLVTLGIGGAWVSTLSRMEPARPIFVILTLGLLIQAGRKLYFRPVACTPGSVCADTAVLRRQRLIFWATALPMLSLLAFPWYASIFY